MDEETESTKERALGKGREELHGVELRNQTAHD